MPDIDQYQSPHSDLLDNRTAPKIRLFRVALSSGFQGSSAIALLGMATMVFMNLAQSRLPEYRDVVLILAFWMLSTLVSILATCTYGVLVLFLARKYNQQHGRVYSFAGVIPGLVTCLVGLIIQESLTIFSGFIVCTYGLIIARVAWHKIRQQLVY